MNTGSNHRSVAKTVFFSKNRFFYLKSASIFYKENALFDIDLYSFHHQGHTWKLKLSENGWKGLKKTEKFQYHFSVHLTSYLYQIHTNTSEWTKEKINVENFRSPSIVLNQFLSD